MTNTCFNNSKCLSGFKQKLAKRCFPPIFHTRCERDVIYMVQKSPAFSDQLITWNQPGLDKIFGTYDEELGGYRYLYRFHPEKKGTYNLEVAFQMESDGVKREGKAKTKIYVR